MNVRFFDRGDDTNPLNGSTIRNNDRLLEIVRGIHSRGPSFCELLGQNGYKLDIGIGPSCGCVQYGLANGDPPYLMAVGQNPMSTNHYEGFLYQNTATEVPARYCMPVETVLEIVGAFLDTGQRSSIVAWEEI